MTKLYYDDGTVLSAVAQQRDGSWVEVQRGTLHGPSLLHRQHWTSKEEWIESVCTAAGVRRQEWAILSDYEVRGSGRHERVGHGWGEEWEPATARPTAREMLEGIRFFQDRYNDSVSVGARLYWLMKLQFVAVGYCPHTTLDYQYPWWIVEWPDLARQIARIAYDAGRMVKAGMGTVGVPGSYYFPLVIAEKGLLPAGWQTQWASEEPVLPDRLDLVVQ